MFTEPRSKVNAFPVTETTALPDTTMSVPTATETCTPVTGTISPSVTVTVPVKTFNKLPVNVTVALPVIVELPK